jgi:hypothetical protein
MAGMPSRVRQATLLAALCCGAGLLLPAAALAAGGTLTPSPAPLEFASAPVGFTQVEAVTLNSEGAGTKIGSMKIEDEEPPGQFGIQTPQGTDCEEDKEIQEGQSCLVNIAFHPTAPGEMKATLVVESDAMNNPVTVPLIGHAVAPEFAISPTSFSFGAVNVGAKSAAKRFTVENRGSGAGTLEELTMTGASPGQFEITADECAEPLEPGGSCSFTVLFAPTSAGSKSASVQVTSRAPESPQTIAVSGTGVSLLAARPIPVQAVAPAKPSNAFSLGKAILNRRRGTAILPVRVPGPGSVLLSGKGLIARSGPGSALVLGAAGTARLAISPAGRKERALGRTGRAKIVAKVTYIPAGGDPLTKAKKIRLVRRHRGRAAHRPGSGR